MRHRRIRSHNFEIDPPPCALGNGRRIRARVLTGLRLEAVCRRRGCCDASADPDRHRASRLHRLGTL